MKRVKVRGLRDYFIEYTAYLLNVQGTRYARQAINVIQDFLDSVPECLQPDDVYLSEREAFLKSFEGKYSDSYISWKFDILRSFWNWMRSKEYATYNPFRALHPQD